MDVNTDEHIYKQQWRQSPEQEKVIHEWVQEMLEVGLIRPSKSPPWSANILCEKACWLKNCTWLPSHEQLHSLTHFNHAKKGCNIWKNVRRTLVYLHGFIERLLSVSNERFGHQVYCFSNIWRLYEYLVIPIGLSNAPTTFNSGIRKILADLQTFCQSYFDDIYVFTKCADIEDHLKALDRVLQRLEDHKFYAKLSKCVFCEPEIPCLGDYIGRNGVRIDPAKVKILKDWPEPKTKSELQSFLGTAVYVQRFCKNFANYVAPLFELLKKKKKFSSLSWNEEHRNHFQQLNATIAITPVLAIADFTRNFIYAWMHQILLLEGSFSKRRSGMTNKLKDQLHLMEENIIQLKETIQFEKKNY